jgi:pheromone shutdown protein TraB
MIRMFQIKRMTVKFERFGNKKVHMVGTVHVSKKSADRVNKTIGAVKPSIVCIELDMQRFRGIDDMRQDLREGGDFRYSSNISEMLNLQGMLRWIQNEIGKEFGVQPGLEMITAIDAAKKNGLKVGLIDRKIDITIARLWGMMPFAEKAKLMSFIAVTGGIFLLKPILGSRAYGIAALFSDKQSHILDMDALEKGEGISELIGLLKYQFPTIYQVLVEERNVFMVNNILKILDGGADNIVVVVGAGHVQGMKYLLEGSGVQVILH